MTWCHVMLCHVMNVMWCEGMGWDAVVMRCGCVMWWIARWCAVTTLPRKYAPPKHCARHEKWHSNFTKYSNVTKRLPWKVALQHHQIFHLPQRVTLHFLCLFLSVALPFCYCSFLWCVLSVALVFLTLLIFRSLHLGSFPAKLPLFAESSRVE